MSRVQSILFDRDMFSLSEAINWVKEHDYIVRKVDITDNYYRIRQEDPGRFKKYRTINIRPGIKFVIGLK